MELAEETENQEVEVLEYVRPLNEEVLNALTHFLALLLSLLGAGLLFSTNASFSQSVANSVYIGSVILTFATSFASHAIQSPKTKYHLKIWDQGVIYLMIAGTYTPYVWKYSPSSMGWGVLAFMWIVAGIGFLSKVFLQHRVDYSFSAISYLVLGWIPALCLAAYLPMHDIYWGAAGGVSYTIGVYFLKNDRHQFYYHAIWHLCVIGGFLCQFYPVWVFSSSS